MLVTLQVRYFVSESAVNYVANSLSNVFEFAALNPSNLNITSFLLQDLVKPNVRLRKANEYFGYIEPVPRNYVVTNETKINGQDVKEDKIIKYCYIPFYKSLANFLQLPEVQMDLDRRLPIHDPANIHDFYGGSFCINHPDFKRENYLKIELNSDDLNVSIEIDVNGRKKRYFGSLFFTLGDFPASTSLHGFKESVSAQHFCPCCDVTRNCFERDIDYEFPCITLEEYRTRCQALEELDKYNSSFEYKNEAANKPHLDLDIAALRARSDDLPLSSMQTYVLLFNLPLILRPVLQNTDFPHYRATLSLLDITDLCFATDIRHDTPNLLKSWIWFHNTQFKILYPGKMKPKLHFLTHLPRQMVWFGPLRYTNCLASERKHQFFKSNKSRNFLNLTRTFSKRHELWCAIVDYNSDSSLSNKVLSDPDERLISKTKLCDLQILDNLQLPMIPTAVLKSTIIDGIEYCEKAVICISAQSVSSDPKFAEIKYILSHNNQILFIYNELDKILFDENLRAFQVVKTNRINYCLVDKLEYKWTAKTLSDTNSMWVLLHPYGLTFSTIPPIN
ncbi:unnamed protein product [Didymodactylos carnosus]|uniref:Uncharacterized protein n=1 Tax=Didymodactylos carnosus TaxID=1234261 RepID=A0A815G487_9BILA|nr:unnamed protein product [Didymodactylos carnosus]CAF4189693.1 unnamed protein product [Didymodactylos carnosus]